MERTRLACCLQRPAEGRSSAPIGLRQSNSFAQTLATVFREDAENSLRDTGAPSELRQERTRLACCLQRPAEGRSSAFIGLR